MRSGHDVKTARDSPRDSPRNGAANSRVELQSRC